MADAEAVRALVARLADLTEEQVVAARTLQGASLQRLLDARTELLFELRVALPEVLEPDAALQAEVARLDQAERRLAAVAATVVDVLDRLDPQSPNLTYGRLGQMRDPRAGAQRSR